MRSDSFTLSSDPPPSGIKFDWVLGPSSKQMENAVLVVQQSWTRIEMLGDIAAIADEFYAIAVQFPHIAKLFANVSMERQKEKFAHMLKYLLDHLHSGSIIELLKCLAIRHVGYGVELSHYNEVGVALLMVVKSVGSKLGVTWDSELDFSWRLAYTMVATTMTEAARPEYVKKGHLPPGLELLGGNAVMQAAQVVSSNATLDQLCHKFLHIIEQYSGCQRSSILLRCEKEVDASLDGGTSEKYNTKRGWHELFHIKSVCENGAASLLDAAVDTHLVPFSLLDICATTLQPVIAADVLSDGVFRADPHFVAYTVRSAIAVPILRHAELLGMVYLEHSFASGVFHAAGAKTLSLLCDQLSISIQMAWMSESLTNRKSELERSNSMIKHAHAAAERFVPKAFLRCIGRSNTVEAQLGDAAELDLTVMFTDVRKFTSICEVTTARGAIQFLNTLLRVVVPCIDQCGGSVDKFLGDGTLSIFRAATDALQAARLIQTQLRILNAKSNPDPFPEIQMGIGIHSGPVVLGCLGTDQRIDVTVVGDTVNLASRLEGIAKLFGARLIVSEDTLKQSLPQDFHGHLEMIPFVRSLGLVLVEGKKRQCRIFEVFEEPDMLHKLGFDAAAAEVKLICASKHVFYEAQCLWKCGHGNQARVLFLRLCAECPGDIVAQRHAAWIEDCGDLMEGSDPQHVAMRFRKNGSVKLVNLTIEK